MRVIINKTEIMTPEEMREAMTTYSNTAIDAQGKSIEDAIPLMKLAAKNASKVGKCYRMLYLSHTTTKRRKATQ